MVIVPDMVVVFVWIVAAYLGIGVVFAIGFVIRGAGRIDPDARDGTWGFRVLIFPGVSALWPWLAYRWWGGAQLPPTESTPHRRPSGNRP